MTTNPKPPTGGPVPASGDIMTENNLWAPSKSSVSISSETPNHANLLVRTALLLEHQCRASKKVKIDSESDNGLAIGDTSLQYASLQNLKAATSQ